MARHVRSFATETEFWRWQCCVLRCAVVDHGRHVTRRAMLLERFAHWRAARASNDGDRQFSTREVSELANDALAQLPAGDAALIRGKYCEGRSTRELAEGLGITVKAVESRLSRLRDRLREIILRIR
jgi:RNA polymerase sigma factor (sigma-70 family)